MASCDCPVATEINDIPANACPIDWARVRKFAISRQQRWESDTSGAASTVSELADLTEWDDVLGASDVTKWVISNLFGEYIKSPGAAQTAEFDGDTKNTGNYDPTTATFQFQGASSDQLAALDTLSCEETLFVMLFDNKNKIIHGFDQTTPTIPIGLPLAPKSFFVTDMYQDEAGNFVKADGGFQLIDGWSKDFDVTSTLAGFNPLTDLVNT